MNEKTIQGTSIDQYTIKLHNDIKIILLYRLLLGFYSEKGQNARYLHSESQRGFSIGKLVQSILGAL